MLAYTKIAVTTMQRVELESYYDLVCSKSRSLMHMQNLSSMGVLDTPALMHRFVTTVSASLHKDEGFQHVKGLNWKIIMNKVVDI